MAYVLTPRVAAVWLYNTYAFPKAGRRGSKSAEAPRRGSCVFQFDPGLGEVYVGNIRKTYIRIWDISLFDPALMPRWESKGCVNIQCFDCQPARVGWLTRQCGFVGGRGLGSLGIAMSPIWAGSLVVRKMVTVASHLTAQARWICVAAAPPARAYICAAFAACS